MGILCLILFTCLAFSVIALLDYKDQYESLLKIYKSQDGVGIIKEPILNTFIPEYYRNEVYTSFYDENKVIHLVLYRIKYQFYKKGDTITYRYHPAHGYYEILN